MSEEAAYVSYVNRAGNTFSLYFSALVIPLGCLLNALSVYVFFRRLRRTRMGYLYGLLGLVDTLSLVTSFCTTHFLPNVGYSLRLQSDAACVFVVFFNRLVLHTSSWLQMFISLDRYLDVRFPKRFPALKRRLTINLVVLAIVALCSLVNLQNFAYFVQTRPAAVARNGTSTLETRSCTASESVLLATELISATMRAWLPLLFMSAVNFLTVRLIVQSHRRISSRSVVRPQSFSKNERQFTRIVLSLNGLFFLLNIPLSISWILTNLNRHAPGSASYTAELNLYYTVALSLAYFYQSLTFLTNLVFNTVFRRECKAMVNRALGRKTFDLATSLTNNSSTSKV